MQDPAELSDRDLVGALLELDSGLTAWEIDLIESIEGWLEDNETLSDRQREVAEQILVEKG